MNFLRRMVVTAVFLSVIGGEAGARVNVLSPWAPGFDGTTASKKPWESSVAMAVGNDGPGGADMTELGATLTTPLKNGWEVGAAWGFRTLNSSGGRDDSGLTDIVFAAKHRLPERVFPDPAKAVGEFGVSLPTGDPHHGIGAGGPGLVGNTGLSLPLGVVHGYGQMGLKLFTAGRGTRWGSQLSYSAGAMYDLTPEWQLTADLRVINHGRDKIDGHRQADADQEAYFSPGGVWKPVKGAVEAQGLLLIGLTGDSYDFGLQVGIRL